MISADCEHIGLKLNCIFILRKIQLFVSHTSFGNFQILCNKILTVWGQLVMRILFKNTQNPKGLLLFQGNALNQEWTHPKCTSLWKIWRSYLKDLICLVHHNLKLFSFLNLLNPRIFATATLNFCLLSTLCALSFTSALVT